MSEELANIARKKKALTDAWTKAGKLRIQAADIEREATENLENVVAFIVSNRLASERAVAREVGCSRYKVREMVKRANERNMKLMRSGYDE